MIEDFAVRVPIVGGVRVLTVGGVGRAASDYLREVGGWHDSNAPFGTAGPRNVDGTPLPSVNVEGAVYVAAGAVILDARNGARVNEDAVAQRVIAQQTLLTFARRLGIPARDLTRPGWLNRWMGCQDPAGLEIKIHQTLCSLDPRSAPRYPQWLRDLAASRQGVAA